MEKVLVGSFEPRNNLEVKMMLERGILLEALQKNGIDSMDIYCEWPRDYFVSHNGNVYTRNKNSFYADGGYVLNNDKFTLVCSDASKIEGEEIDNTNKRYEKLKKLYGENVSILPPPDLRWNLQLSPHIDMVVLPIPERNVLFVDSLYYHKIARKEIDKLCDRYNLKLERTVNDYNKPSYPCNSLILNKNNDLIAITNKINNEGFIFRLRDYGLNVIDVPFEANCAKGGSVHCATNTISENYIPQIEELLDDRLEIFK